MSWCQLWSSTPSRKDSELEFLDPRASTDGHCGGRGHQTPWTCRQTQYFCAYGHCFEEYVWPMPQRVRGSSKAWWPQNKTKWEQQRKRFLDFPGGSLLWGFLHPGYSAETGTSGSPPWPKPTTTGSVRRSLPLRVMVICRFLLGAHAEPTAPHSLLLATARSVPISFTTSAIALISFPRPSPPPTRATSYLTV